MRAPFVALLLAIACAGCGAGQRRILDAHDVSPSLAGSETPFRAMRLSWVETGDERYDRFFREAAALQGAIFLGERAAAGEREPAPLLPVLAGIAQRSDAALAEGQALLARARADFAHDEKKALAIEPALHEALGQVRDAAARGPALLSQLRGAEPPAAAGGMR